MFHGSRDSRENMVDEFFQNKQQDKKEDEQEQEEEEEEEKEKKSMGQGERQQSQYNSLEFDTFNPVKNVNPQSHYMEASKSQQHQVKFNVPLPLRKQDVEKYVYAQQDPHELSTPGRITNPDNASQSEVTIEESPLPNFVQEKQQFKQKKQGGKSNNISDSKQVQGSDIDLNYSFSQIGGGQGRSTLKKSASSALIKQDEKARSGKIAQDLLQFQKMVTQEYKKKYQESDKQHRDILGQPEQLNIEMQNQQQNQEQEKKDEKFIGENTRDQDQNTSLADVFRARKFQMLSKFQNRKLLKDAEFEKKKSSASSTVSGRSKEQILKLRKEMMKPKNNKPASEGDSPEEQKQESKLMRRLAMGEKVKLSKKEMHDLSSKNYEKLPQIQRQKDEQQKKEMIRQKHEKMKQFDEQRKLDLKKQKK